MYKTMIKMRVTSEQSVKIQEIVFKKGGEWCDGDVAICELDKPYLFIGEDASLFIKEEKNEFDSYRYEEIDPELFIRTNGTCNRCNEGIESKQGGIKMNKIKLQQQIEELKAKISEMEIELNKIEEKKSIGINFEYPKSSTYLIAGWEVSKVLFTKDTDYLSNFRYRQTETNAKADFQLQKELMCIGALADQIDPNYRDRVVWNNSTRNYYIIFNTRNNKYVIDGMSNYKTLGVVFMPKDVAERVCEILNNKGVEL